MHPAKCFVCKPYESKYTDFSNGHVALIKGSCLKPLALSQHFAWLGVHTSSAGGDPRYVTTLKSLVTISILIVRKNASSKI